MASVPMDIVEIRRTVFGKAMREPIADACLHLKEKNRDSFVKRLDRVEVQIITDNKDTYCADSGGTTNLSVSSIEENDYLLTDSRSSDSVALIEDTDYSLRLNDPSWESVVILSDEDEYYLILQY